MENIILVKDKWDINDEMIEELNKQGIKIVIHQDLEDAKRIVSERLCSILLVDWDLYYEILMSKIQETQDLISGKIIRLTSEHIDIRTPILYEWKINNNEPKDRRATKKEN